MWVKCHTVITLLFLMTCCKDSETKKESIVYIGGNRVEGDNSKTTTIAKYWKNGVPNEVAKISVDAYNGAGISITAIAVSGEDIYLAGRENDIAKYWKNGVGVPLSDGKTVATATCIEVSGSDVYIGGFDYDSGAKYWKKGILVPLENASTYISRIRAMTTSGNDIYLVGRSDAGAAFWKNGIVTNITDPGSYFTSIAVSGKDIYVAGLIAKPYTSGFYFPFKANVAAYWKNGLVVELSNDFVDSEALSIAVSDGDIHVVGNEGWFARYWKNGEVIDGLRDASSYKSIAINEDNIHIIGTDRGLPTYWKNGTATVIGIYESSTTSSKLDVLTCIVVK